MAAGQSAGHAGDGGPADHGLGRFGVSFVIAGQPAVGGEPGQGAFDAPAAITCKDLVLPPMINGVARVDISCVGGPVDGRVADVDVGDDGVPPDVLPESWLWSTYGSELLDADLHGRYELEPVAGTGPPWLYVWRSDGTAHG